MTATLNGERGVFLSGIVLAAGASTRMGRPKQLLPLAGRPLLQHVLDQAAAAGLDEILLVLGHAADEIRSAVELPARCPVRVVMNAAWAEGQSTSLRAGLRAADPRSAAAAILLGDQPGVTRALIDRVADVFLAGVAPVARPVWHDGRGERVPGHPVFLARRTWPEVEQLSGDQGARVLLRARPDWLLEVDVAGEPPDDIDEWRDYLRAAATLGAAAARS